MTLWEERAARNEALFREVNRQAERLGQTWQAPTEPLLLVCECADDACAERLAVAPDLYAQVRSNPRQFLIRPGHQHAAVERVVVETTEYVVVEKTGAAGRIAERTADPSPE